MNIFDSSRRGSNPDGTFNDRDQNAGITGTLITADIFNQIGYENEALVKAAGLTPSSEDNTQWLQAVRKLYCDADTVLKSDITEIINQGDNTVKTELNEKIDKEIADRTEADINLQNQIDKIKSFQYKTTEFDTGKKWIDGRNIYGRVFVLPKESISLPYYINDDSFYKIEHLIDTKLMLRNQYETNTSISNNCVSTAGQAALIVASIEYGSLVISVHPSMSSSLSTNTDCYVYIEYIYEGGYFEFIAEKSFKNNTFEGICEFVQTNNLIRKSGKIELYKDDVLLDTAYGYYIAAMSENGFAFSGAEGSYFNADCRNNPDCAVNYLNTEGLNKLKFYKLVDGEWYVYFIFIDNNFNSYYSIIL